MIRKLPAQVWQARARMNAIVRRFMEERQVLEVETPLLGPHGTVEPFLDPFCVQRRARRKGPQQKQTDAYLITSPEYNLKILLGDLRRDVFQIAHCFREGDDGPLHSEEFLMLEWYRMGFDEHQLMHETAELLQQLSIELPLPAAKAPAPTTIVSQSVSEIFQQFVGCGLTRGELETALTQNRLLGSGEDVQSLRYDELFFSLFLNKIENQLGQNCLHFLYDYPPELAALSTIEHGRARRFELYWQGVELANGYYELRDATEQQRRFAEENNLRRSMGKPAMAPDQQFVQALADGLPACSGIALGLDRLLMVLWGASDLSEVSPFVMPRIS